MSPDATQQVLCCLQKVTELVQTLTVPLLLPQMSCVLVGADRNFSVSGFLLKHNSHWTRGIFIQIMKIPWQVHGIIFHVMARLQSCCFCQVSPETPGQGEGEPWTLGCCRGVLAGLLRSWPPQRMLHCKQLRLARQGSQEHLRLRARY